MFIQKLDFLLLLMVFNVSYCVRRIKDGAPVTKDKPYVVYLVKAPMSNKLYDAWLCGGALVSSLFVISSAACVDDVEYLYAIAGYKKYVPDSSIEADQCTKNKKKKVIYTCIPMKYELKYDQLEKWSFIDIALLKVESAYDFNDESYIQLCSYIPTTIPINYETKYQEVNTDAMVLGWGHTEVWRKPNDLKNYNQEMLRYAPTLIMDKTICKRHYEMFPNMSQVIDQFMICTLEKGNIDDKGETLLISPPTAEGCESGKQMLMGTDGVICDDEDSYNHDIVIDSTRREVVKSNQTFYNISIVHNINRSAFFNESRDQSRKSGICQNDHGGPLVTWVGTREVLIGVASVFKVSDDSKCMGPYLYTSTQCNGAFLDCVLSTTDIPDKNRNRRAICDSPPIQRGYDTVERHISWRNHPSGPADNERAAALKVKYTGSDSFSNLRNPKSTMLNEQFAKLDKFSEHQIFAVRPQRPLTN